MNQRGVTLIEVIVTFTISALLITAVVGFFSIALATYRKTSERTEFTTATLFFHSLLKNNLESLYYSDLDPRSAFYGQSDRLTFTSIQENNQGLFKRHILIAILNGRKTIEVMVKPALPEASPLLTHTLTKVQQAHVDYFDPNTQTWLRTWTYKQRWPRFVRLSFNHKHFEQTQYLIFEVLYDQII